MSACVALPVTAVASKFLPKTQQLDHSAVARYEGYKVGLEDGWMTLNEVRYMENLPSVTVKKNDSSIGSIDGATGAFTFASSQTLVPGYVLTIEYEQSRAT